jgi:glycosyltransferase involved in cell wall biosynthesis
VANRQRIGVVVPLFNEREHVAQTLRDMPACVDEIIVINDGSTDGSDAIVESLCDPRVMLLQHATRYGVGAALRTGFSHAATRELSVVVTMDADGQMDVGDFARVVAPVLEGRAEYVKGSRFEPGIDLGAMPVQRRFANRLLTRITGRILGVPGLRDAHCGYTAASGRVVEHLASIELYRSYGVYTSILAAVLEMDAPVEFVPVKALYGEEKSHIRPLDLAGLAWLLTRYGMRR